MTKLEKEIRKKLTARQQKLLDLCQLDQTPKQILNALKIGHTTFYKELKVIRKVAKKEAISYKSSKEYYMNTIPLARRY